MYKASETMVNREMLLRLLRGAVECEGRSESAGWIGEKLRPRPKAAVTFCFQYNVSIVQYCWWVSRN